MKRSFAAGEEKTVSFELGKRAFAYFDEKSAAGRLKRASLKFSSAAPPDTLLTKTVTVNSLSIKKEHFDRNSTIGEVIATLSATRF